MLGRPIHEVMDWPPGDLILWRGWALIQHEEMEKARQEAESRRSSR
jgi:hypothetical protein